MTKCTKFDRRRVVDRSRPTEGFTGVKVETAVERTHRFSLALVVYRTLGNSVGIVVDEKRARIDEYKKQRLGHAPVLQTPGRAA